jgi:hypothetical protein
MHIIEYMRRVPKAPFKFRDGHEVIEHIDSVWHLCIECANETDALAGFPKASISAVKHEAKRARTKK